MEDKYKTKYQDICDYFISVIEENVALAHEVAISRRRVSIIHEENKSLLRQLREVIGDRRNDYYFPRMTSRRRLTAMKRNPRNLVQRRRGPRVVLLAAKPGQLTSGLKGGIKRIRKTYRRRKLNETIQLQHDVCGQVIFPITLKDFEIHSLGEIIYDKPSYHTEDLIYPVGFCSTHVYGSVRNPEMKCIYTCKISDGGDFPRFEISSDGEDGACFVGTTPNECHSQLIAAINSVYDKPFLIDDLNRGADFFGLSHPTMHELILSLSGVDKCSKYSTKNFAERNKLLDKDPVLKQLVYATINYDALLNAIPKATTKEESSDE